MISTKESKVHATVNTTVITTVIKGIVRHFGKHAHWLSGRNSDEKMDTTLISVF